MAMDALDTSRSSHGGNRHQPFRGNPLPPSESEGLEENVFEARERGVASMSYNGAAGGEGEGSIFSAVRHQKSTPATSDYSEMKQRLSALEKKLAASASNKDSASLAGQNIASIFQNDSGLIFENGLNEDAVDQLQIVPGMCEKTWSDFMNKHMDDNKEYAIEILVEEPDYYHNKERAAAKAERRYGKSRKALTTTTDDESGPILPERADKQRTMPSRIRINSTLILKTLTTLDEHIDATASLVMLRPFKFLVHYKDQIEDLIRSLEHQLAEPEQYATAGSSETLGSSDPMSSLHEREVKFRHTENRQETLQHMRCLADFLNLYIKPTVSRLQDSTDSRVLFRDLWYIFRPGEDIYIPLKGQDTSVNVDWMGITPETFHSRYNQWWRVTGTSGGRPNIAVAQNRNAILRLNSFKVDCYYIDFHGRFFHPTVHTFEIMPFMGERDINSLDFYPARYLKASQQQQRIEGDNNSRLIFEAMAHSFTQFFYSGPTLMVHPCGCKLQGGPTVQEHIESEVIVDFKMALRKKSLWQPPQEPWKDPVIERHELQETNPLRHWADHRRIKVQSTEYDQVYNDYFIDRERAMIFRDNEQIFAPIPSGWLSNESMIPEKDIVLLPSRIFAFVLRTRTFAPVWLLGLQPIKAKTEGLDNLQLKDNSFKDTLQALVKMHFMQQQTQHASIHEYDIVRGKGRGLVLLLHGAPGVGKTFTAESVAAANGQPLLQITSGDLGLKPQEVDAALKEIFWYAQHWKCVLLLDECDILLTQRTKTDIKRNALVSIFLRVLEFYTGVLFLTTNRVGALDEAINSRITWILYYPPLNWTQPREIWKTSIKRVESGNKNLDVDKNGIIRYAKLHFKASMLENAVWNGRRIQNAFKVATALACWEAYSTEERGEAEQLGPMNDDHRPRSTLSAIHFRTYATGTRAFDTYFQEATGFNDADRAFHAMERADDHVPDEDAALMSPVSPGYGGNQLPSFRAPHDDLRKTSSVSLVPPSAHGRSTSPNFRPQLTSRLSSSQLLQYQHSPPKFSRQNAPMTAGPPLKRRRRSSQMTSLGPPNGPVTRIRPSNEPRGSIDHDFAKQLHDEHDDIGIETEDADCLDEHEPAEGYLKSDSD